MSTVTTLLGLTKPAGVEQFSLATYNNNLDLIDTEAISVRAMAQGVKTRLKTTSNSGAISTLVVVNNIASFSFKGGRKYRIVWHGEYVATAGNYFAFKAGTCSTADAANLTTGITTIQSKTHSPNGTSLTETFFLEALYEPVSDITLQVKFTAERVVGAATMTLIAVATSPIVYYIEDQGAQY